MVKGKRRIENIQQRVDRARLDINRVNGDLILAQNEGPASLTLDEVAEMLDALSAAELQIGKAIEELQAGGE